MICRRQALPLVVKLFMGEDCLCRYNLIVLVLAAIP